MAVLTLSQSEQHEALLRRKIGQIRCQPKMKGLKTIACGLLILPVAWADCPVCNLNLEIRGVLPEPLVPGLRPSLLLSLAAALRASSGEPMRISPEN